MMMESVWNCGTPGSSVGMVRLGGAFQMWATRTDLREQIDTKNHQFRIDGMPITGMRKAYIVNQGVEDEQASEQEDPVDAISNGEHESGDREQRRGQEQRVLELLQCLDLGQTRKPVPVKNKLAEGDDGKLFRVIGDPLLCQSRLLGRICGLAHLLVLAVEDRILAGMIHAHPDTFGERIVAAANLDSDVVAHENRLVEDFVITHQPGHHRHPEEEGGDNGREHESLAATVKLVGEPASGEGKE